MSATEMGRITGYIIMALMVLLFAWKYLGKKK
jgi:hypothetical protein